MISRRSPFVGAAAVSAASVSRVALTAIPEAVQQTSPDTAPPPLPSSGRPYNPVLTLNGWTCPWRMKDGVKEFHLVAEAVVREMAPGFKAHSWGYNGQSPGPTIEVVEGDRARIRVGNLTMTNHPIHLHGHEFEVTGTDGGPVPKSARWPEVTTDVAVAQMRRMAFVADEEGDWAFHCHKSHHTMNAMGHDVEMLIGVGHTGLASKITHLIPDYMAMGERGMADMGEMEMPLPDNTAPMMAGQGPYGGLEMGGMFSVLKVRKQQMPGDFSDPGWYATQAPQGTVAAPAPGAAAPAASQAPAPSATTGIKHHKPGMHDKMHQPRKPAAATEVKLRKPSKHEGR